MSQTLPDPPAGAPQIRLGIVGLGLAGGVMAASVETHAGFALNGAAETNADLRARFEQGTGAPAHEDISELVRRSDIDAVYIATPHQFHREQAVLAAEHGKHVVVEKPMALSLEDCDIMIAAAERNGVQLIVGHTHGFDPALKVMREQIEGPLGESMMLTSLNHTDYLYRPRRPEELDTDLGGGALFNQLPHQVEIVRTLKPGPVRSVRAVANRLDVARPTEGGCIALIEFEDGAAASLIYSGYDGFDSDELHGWISEGGYPKSPAHGSARRALKAVGGQVQETALRRSRFGYGSSTSTAFPPHQPHFGLLLVTCLHGEMRQTADGVMIYDADGARELTIPKTGWRPGRGDVLEALRRAVVLGEQPLHDGAFGRATLAVCLAILKSSRERRDVRIGEVG